METWPGGGKPPTTTTCFWPLCPLVLVVSVSYWLNIAFGRSLRFLGMIIPNDRISDHLEVVRVRSGEIRRFCSHIVRSQGRMWRPQGREKKKALESRRKEKAEERRREQERGCLAPLFLVIPHERKAPWLLGMSGCQVHMLLGMSKEATRLGRGDPPKIISVESSIGNWQ